MHLVVSPSHQVSFVCDFVAIAFVSPGCQDIFLVCDVRVIVMDGSVVAVVTIIVVVIIVSFFQLFFWSFLFCCSCGYEPRLPGQLCWFGYCCLIRIYKGYPGTASGNNILLRAW